MAKCLYAQWVYVGVLSSWSWKSITFLLLTTRTSTPRTRSEEIICFQPLLLEVHAIWYQRSMVQKQNCVSRLLAHGFKWTGLAVRSPHPPSLCLPRPQSIRARYWVLSLLSYIRVRNVWPAKPLRPKLTDPITPAFGEPKLKMRISETVTFTPTRIYLHGVGAAGNGVSRTQLSPCQSRFFKSSSSGWFRATSPGARVAFDYCVAHSTRELQGKNGYSISRLLTSAFGLVSASRQSRRKSKSSYFQSVYTLRKTKKEICW